MTKFPSASDIIEEAAKTNPDVNINELHELTYGLMLHYKDRYYSEKVDEFFSRISLKGVDKGVVDLIKCEMLKPIVGGNKTYPNVMEEASRRISQTFQPISGNIAEGCVEKEILKFGLKFKVHYLKKMEHTDFIFYYPSIENEQGKHRVEVKNVSVRERAARGLIFDGDSLFGFFNDPSEFTIEFINNVNDYCTKSRGYCYVPPSIITSLEDKLSNSRFRSNTEFAKDMVNFVKTGSI